MTQPLEPYDQEAVHDEQIAPLMNQIIALCKEHGIPMIASFAYARDEDGEYDMCTSSIPREDASPAKYARIINYLTQEEPPQ